MLFRFFVCRSLFIGFYSITFILCENFRYASEHEIFHRGPVSVHLLALTSVLYTVNGASTDRKRYWVPTSKRSHGFDLNPEMMHPTVMTLIKN